MRESRYPLQTKITGGKLFLQFGSDKLIQPLDGLRSHGAQEIPSVIFVDGLLTYF